MFKNTYELSLNSGYVSHWGLLEAVRELIQNAIDSESPFVYEFEEDDIQGTITLILRSEFTTLSPKTLLLGSTSKADSKDSIGSFGEGYKIALLVLTRLNKQVLIANGDKLWTPMFKYNEKFQEDLLVIKESALPHKHSGLTFKVTGLSADDVSGIVDSCLHMQRSKGEIKTTNYGDILIDKPGKLYVGGLYICDTELEFGYDIKPEFIKLERDRQTVSSWDLNTITRDMWLDTHEYENIAEMIDRGCEDLQYAKYYSTEILKEACYKLFRKSHPGAVAAKNQEELESLIKQGMEKVIIVKDTMHSLVTSSSSYKSETLTKIESIQQKLQRWYDENKFNMHHKCKKSFAEILEQSAKWRIV